MLTFRAQFPQNFAAVDPGPEQPAFRAWIYSLDLLLPVVQLNQRDAWVPHGAAQTLSTLFTIIGWFIATVLVAGIAGVVKRE